MSLATEYFILVFIAALGFIQIAALRSHLKGLLFSQNPIVNYVISGLLIAPGAIFFFTWNYHNPVGIIEGAQQAELFAIAAALAVAATLILGSVLNYRRLKPVGPPSGSIEALKDRTFFQAFLERYLWKS
jgi:hypothetical protein